MLWILGGTILAGIGVLGWALCVVAGRADEQMERMMEEREKEARS